MASHFKPTNRYNQFESPFNTNNALRYEGMKASFVADLLATESCLGKCSAGNNVSNTTFASEEKTCLRECTLKYFDAQLLVENELMNFARGEKI